MAGGLYVGIDLGTSNSAAAVFDGVDVAMVRNPQGGFLTPSIVRMDARGTLLVGARAKRYLETHPQDVASEFKRLMGTRRAIHFASAKTDRLPLDLAAEVLKALRADIEAQTQVAPTCAVISVPALFELPQCQDTAAAARQAGFERCELIAEPIASALAAGWRAETAEGSWLIYDLGGGTFDVSLLDEHEGFLRVVGHDGDNFLGGRDLDLAVVDWALDELARETGAQLSRANPEHRDRIIKVKQAAEEARIELSRSETTVLVLPEDDVELPIDRTILERLCVPLVDRSIAVSKRLLDRHASEVRKLSRVVLVGGPTVTPFLRRQVALALQEHAVDGSGERGMFGQILDPMTLVAQGASVHAASVGLNARADVVALEQGKLFSLSYPAMTSDDAPVVVGSAASGGDPAPRAIRLVRSDGWASEDAALNEQGVFAASVSLLAHQASQFQLVGLDRLGQRIPVRPSLITIVHGLTVGSPPLARSVGVATANDEVRVFFPRGTALPARRTWSFSTVETIARGARDNLLKVPIVQGESTIAHLCRVVGKIDIQGAALAGSLPLGSEIEVTLEVDRSGQLSGWAVVPLLGQRFDHVAQLLLPDADADALKATVEPLRERLQAATMDAGGEHFEALLKAGFLLTQAASDLDAALGGDLDAAQKARRTLLEVDEAIERAHVDALWQDLEHSALELHGKTALLLERFGTSVEKHVLQQVIGNLARARASRQLTLFETHLKVLEKLADAAFLRQSDAPLLIFNHLLNHMHRSLDAARAETLMQEGKQARDAGDMARLRRIADELWSLQPYHEEDRKRGHDSGVR